MTQKQNGPVFVCGIDPGIHGAAALVRNGLVFACYSARPSELPTFVSAIEEYAPRICVVEEPRMMFFPNSSGKKVPALKQAVTLARMVGQVEGTLGMCRFPTDIQRVHPTTWQSVVLGKRKKKVDAKQRALRFLKTQDLFFLCQQERMEVFGDHNKTDACLIALYAWFVWTKQQKETK